MIPGTVLSVACLSLLSFPKYIALKLDHHFQLQKQFKHIGLIYEDDRYNLIVMHRAEFRYFRYPGTLTKIRNVVNLCFKYLGGLLFL